MNFWLGPCLFVDFASKMKKYTYKVVASRLYDGLIAIMALLKKGGLQFLKNNHNSPGVPPGSGHFLFHSTTNISF